MTAIGQRSNGWASTRSRIASAAASGPGAMTAAVAECAGGLGGDPALVLVFPSGPIGEHDPFEAARAASAARLAGLTVKGGLGGRGLVDSGCSAIAFDDSFTVGTASSPRARVDLRAAAANAVDGALGKLGPHAPPNRLVVMFVDPASGNQAEAVAGAYSVTGARIPLIGGGAGGEDAAPIDGASGRADSVVAVAIASPRPIAIGAAHGCLPQEAPAIVTRSEGRLIEEIDGRPAAEVFLERHGWRGARPSDTEFERFAVLRPLSQPELNGSVRLRHVHGRGPGESLHVAAEVGRDAGIEFTSQTPEAIVEAAGRAVRRSIAGLGGESAVAALVFDCAGRRVAAGEQLDDAIDAVPAALPAACPVAGGFTYGELARTTGATGDLNHAIAVAAFA